MADTKIAPRRWPFPIGTKLIFVQAAAPVDWVQDTSPTIHDRFIRTSAVPSGGGTGGPLGLTTGSASIDMTHRHTYPSHQHSLNSHTHDLTHYHPFNNVRTRQQYDGSEGYWSEPYYNTDWNPEVKDDGGGYGDWDTNKHHLGVDAGASYEGSHHHDLPSNTGSDTSDTTGLSTNLTSGVSNRSYTEYSGTLTHTHTVKSDFRLKYKDVIVATLVQ